MPGKSIIAEKDTTPHSSTTLLSRGIVLSSQQSKTRLTSIISEYLLSTFQSRSNQHSLYVTADEMKGVCAGVVLRHDDPMSNHEEADVIIPFQVNEAI